MSMRSPNALMEDYKNRSYKELLKIRDKLIEDIKDFENNPKQSSMIISPSPEVRYQCNLEYLSKICKLIAEKYNYQTIDIDTDFKSWGIEIIT